MSPRRREALILAGAGVLATAAGFLAGPLLLKLGGHQSGAALAAARYPDLDGRVRRLTEWNGGILVCNFWATWCAPCREEIPILLSAREKFHPSGVEMVGIAIDNAPKVQEYVSNMHISYPVLIAEASGLDLMRELGNAPGGLPYTVVASRSGDIVATKLGAFKADELDVLLARLTRP